MTADNFTSVLEGLRGRKPFTVFTVELQGGRRFEVDHPGALVVRDGERIERVAFELRLRQHFDPFCRFIQQLFHIGLTGNRASFQ